MVFGSDIIQCQLFLKHTRSFSELYIFLCSGIIAPVAGTAYDLRTPTRLGDRLKNVNNGKGYDTNFCVGGQLGKLTRVARQFNSMTYIIIIKLGVGIIVHVYRQPNNKMGKEDMSNYFSIILKIETMSKTKYSPEFYNFKVLHVLTFLVAQNIRLLVEKWTFLQQSLDCSATPDVI